MADHLEASVTLPSEPGSARAARDFVADTVRGWGLPDGDEAADSIRLIISELATNAVRHASWCSPTFTVSLRLDRDEEFGLGVTDGHPCWPRAIAPADGRDSGRGLEIVRCLTAELGGRLRVKPAEQGGKTIWVVMPWAGRPQPPDGMLNRFGVPPAEPRGCRGDVTSYDLRMADVRRRGW